jgi:hypothetical protein
MFDGMTDRRLQEPALARIPRGMTARMIHGGRAHFVYRVLYLTLSQIRTFPARSQMTKS